MNRHYNLFLQIITHVMLLFSVVVFVFQWAIRALSLYGVDGYDGALKLLPWAYTVSGFMPYRDFGVIYPPGAFFLAEIIPLPTLEERNMLMYGLFFLVVLVGIALVCRFRSLYERTAWAISGFLLLTVSLLDSENMADLLLGLLMLTVVYTVRRRADAVSMAMAFFFPFLIVLWRWDRIGIFLLLETICFIVLAQKNMLRMLFIQFAGVSVGIITLAAYLFFRGGINNGLDFLYSIPLPVAMPYRDLPVPHLFSYPGILFLVTWSSLAVFSLYVIQGVFFRRVDGGMSYRSVMTLLILAPFSALPYALGRSDGAHIIPMHFLTGLSVSMGMLFVKRRGVLFLLSLLVIMIVPALYIHGYSHASTLSMTRLLDEQLLDCREKTNDLRYRSVFVGRALYERYIANNLALYFFNTSVPPATQYVSEDPGVQNSCIYGERIAGQLDRSPKPMLAFITDQSMDGYEENKTREMKSCGKIEQYLTGHQYRVFGRCISYNTSYEIRIYE